MKRKIILSVTVVFLFLFVSFWGMAEEAGNNPVAVSPGSETEAVTVWQSCPTFSWTSVDQAASYRVVVFEAIDPIVMPYEDMATNASPVISKDIPGPALSWTLSAEESLKSGSMYVWYVQAVDATGNGTGTWSGGRIFKVEQEVRFAGVEEKLAEKLRDYGVNEETITNVLKDIKSDVKEVVVRNGGAGGKNTPDASRVQGYEGDSNTFYGLQAGYSNSTGTYNTFIGSGAGYFNASAYSNTFLGYNAGYGNTTGTLNSFIGRSAGSQNTTGNQNTFIGHFSGFYNSTGISNTFLGAYAGNWNTSGHFNTFLGHSAGLSNTTGCNNTFLGQIAGYSNTIGHSNTFIGNEAGNGNTEGSENTFIGRGAGAANTTGNSNTFIGRSAGTVNTTGNANTLLGYTSGSSNTTGSYNTFIGYEAGKATTTGNNNTFIGYAAGKANTTGYQNIFIGNYAGFAHTTGNDNTFLGFHTGHSNTTGVCNVFLGNEAGYHNTSGNFNVFLGHDAGYYSTTAIANTFIGNSAGENNTTGDNNTFLGRGAGQKNTTGSTNTLLGHSAGYNNSTGVGNVFLGFNAGYNETSSNKLYISNFDTSSPLIYGEFDNSLLKINGNLGVTGYLSLDNGATQINSTELNLLHGLTSISMGSTDNDKLVTKGYVDENDDVGGGGLTGSDMSDTYICKWDDANTRLVDSLISESPGVIKINGKLGIGTSTPDYPIELETTGQNAAFTTTRTDGATNFMSATASYAQFGAVTDHPVRLLVNSAWKMMINTNGSLSMANGATCTTGGVWTNASSRELKENIICLGRDEAVDALTKLSPVKYNYKVDKTDKHVGFIAEDAPELVATADRKGMSPMDVVAVLTRVVQEQQKIISDLQERIAKIEKAK